MLLCYTLYKTRIISGKYALNCRKDIYANIKELKKSHDENYVQENIHITYIKYTPKKLMYSLKKGQIDIQRLVG